ncbi:MAG: hypothetical protein ABIO81_10730 [Ginsengibacter sp.]
MKNKIMPLIISCVLISFSALSQTPEKSSHPKLDSFYKLKQNSRAAIVSDTSAAPIANPGTVKNPIISNNPAASLPSPSKVTFNNIKPTNNVTQQNQPQQPVQTMPAQKPVYRDTRLGSSSKMYDTYEKNNNGAGAVTATPK